MPNILFYLRSGSGAMPNILYYLRLGSGAMPHILYYLRSGSGARARERVLFLNLRNGLQRVLFLTGVFVRWRGGVFFFFSLGVPMIEFGDPMIHTTLVPAIHFGSPSDTLWEPVISDTCNIGSDD